MTETPVYKITIDENSFWTGAYAKVGDIKDSVECLNLPKTEDLTEARAYKYNTETKELIFDEGRYQELLTEKTKQETYENNLEEISKLKEQLNDTDYKIIKCYEYSLAGIELPYDVDLLHEERQALRDKINEIA